MQNSKFWVITFILGLASVYLLIGDAKLVYASSADNVSGWAWSSNIGWIHFNGANYGVHICESDTDTHAGCGGAGTAGKMVGYAWSENVGWIMFSPSGAPEPAMVDSDGNVTGWARACAGTANGDCNSASRTDGWDGWIKLAGPTYATNIDFNPSPAEFHNYAWGSDVVGWISFNCAEGSASGGSVCGTSDYKVTTTYSPKPKVIDLDIRQTSDYCTSGPSITVSWTFVGSEQSAYQVRIYEGNFATLVKDSGKVELPSYSFSTIDGIVYNKTYSWEVQVWDLQDRSSGWVKDTKIITTPAHQYPDIKMVGFSWSPKTPALGENMQFTNGSNCYDVNGPVECSSWSWNIPNATYVAPSNSSIRSPVVKFTMIGNFLVGLTATDADNNSCTATNNINISSPLPEWREITPR